MSAGNENIPATQDGAASAPPPEQDFDAAVAEFSEDKADPSPDAAAEAIAGTPDASAAGAPAPSPDAAPDDAAGNEPPASQNPNDDIWSTADPKLREAHENAIRDAKLRIEGIKGRQSAADREAARLRERIAELEQGKGKGNQQEPQAQPEAATGAAGLSKEQLEKLREDFPEIAGPLLDRIEEQERQFGELMSKVGKLEAPVGTLEQERQVAAIQTQETLLSEKHKDWLEVASDERFQGWVNSQPRAIQEAMQRNFDAIVDGQEAALVISLYKTEMGIGAPSAPPPPSTPDPVQEKRQRQMQSGRDTGRTGPSVTTGIPDDFDAAVNAFAKNA